jgi:hypothetical protein
MNAASWEALLAGALALNAVLGFSYRAYRVTKGGPVADVVGQAVLGIILGATAVAVALGSNAARWVALAYGLLFGVAVMPVWTLAVLIPMRPGPVDYAFTAIYWLALALVVIASIAA